MADREDYPDLGVSDATLRRGYSTVRDPDMPPKTISIGMGDGERIRVPNYERMTWDEDDGRMVDAYAGGFLPRTPHCPDER